jgi:hypothetical protein
MCICYRPWYATVHRTQTANDGTGILIFMFVSPPSIISVSHSLNRKSDANGKIGENEVLDKA